MVSFFIIKTFFKQGGFNMKKTGNITDAKNEYHTQFDQVLIDNF